MKIRPNLGMLDRALRFLIAIAIVALYITDTINGLTATILLILSAILIGTSIVSFCPLYLPFNINTQSKKTE